MHAIVTKLTLAKPIDDALLRSVKEEVYPQMRDNPGFIDLHIVRVSDAEAILLGFFRSRETLDEISSKIAGPWFAEHVRPYRAGPVQRSVGEVAWSSSG
ncbi:MAG: hypothetical protein ACHQ53_15275 [Polyangiales bacterium]